MAKTHSPPPDTPITMGLKDAMRRLIPTSAEELASEVVRDQERARLYVEKRQESIRKGARRGGKRFSL